MKKYLWAFILILLPIQSFALMNVKFVNKSLHAIELASIDTNSNHTLNPTIVSQISIQSSFITQGQRLIINNNYAIQLVDTGEECSYLNAFNIRYSNGTKIELYINNNKLSSICSTKKHYLTYAKNIELIFANNSNPLFISDVLIIRNAGWWANTNGYPVEKNILLNAHKMNLSSEQIAHFMVNGIIL
ncbi:hypothetical protein [Pigmentibacter ruber]|uniref:hypothetical protein n=1 Tax=Pigmentibacter ruber TaxID=2683196 RepID=UPI00131AC153|nr:hypothetical protein [Pigmentibacter ruber]